MEDGTVEGTAAVTGTGESGDVSRDRVGLHETEDAVCSATSRQTSKILFDPTDALAYSPVAVSPVKGGTEAQSSDDQ